jgi:hypothetical protein
MSGINYPDKEKVLNLCKEEFYNKMSEALKHTDVKDLLEISVKGAIK